MLLLPRRSLFAGLEAEHDVTHPHRLARLERRVARNAVPLVKDAERGDTLRHRRRAKAGVDPARDVDGHDGLPARVRIQRGVGGFGRGRGRNILRSVAPRRRQQRGHTGRAQRAPDHASGVQAS
jgi:hypothetical protein